MKVYRIHNGRKEYKRTKTADQWTTNPAQCWNFSKQGAANIVKRLTELQHPQNQFYIYGSEEA